MQEYSIDQVRGALRAAAPDIDIMIFENSTATSQLAAEAIGCELGQIAKSLLFIVDEQPVVVIASGDQRIDDRKLAQQYNVARKKIRFASAEQCIAITGYAPGGVPPLGYRTAGLPIHLDNMLKRYETVYPAAGAHNACFPIALARLEQITGGVFTDVRRED